MNLGQLIKDKIYGGIERLEHENAQSDTYVDYVEEEYRQPVSGHRRSYVNYDEYEPDNVTHIKPDVQRNVVLAPLKSVDGAPAVIDSLRAGDVCIVNLEGVELDTAQRIADFLGGASHAMNGAIKRVNENIFIMAPEGVNINDLIRSESKSLSNILPWVSKAKTARY
ncbi:MAG: cell division protein SepF [Clostridiales bacterium]|jgi:FtsZ-interacting cell division protein YlmF|nr:cell division protein SepF [Clostridiales bacterium]